MPKKSEGLKELILKQRKFEEQLNNYNTSVDKLLKLREDNKLLDKKNLFGELPPIPVKMSTRKRSTRKKKPAEEQLESDYEDGEPEIVINDEVEEPARRSRKSREKSRPNMNASERLYWVHTEADGIIANNPKLTRSKAMKKAWQLYRDTYGVSNSAAAVKSRERNENLNKALNNMSDKDYEYYKKEHRRYINAKHNIDALLAHANYAVAKTREDNLIKRRNASAEYKKENPQPRKKAPKKQPIPQSEVTERIRKLRGDKRL